MIGTGTKTDPYIPENWDEFVTAIGTTDAHVELPEGGGTFDMNDIDPVGGSKYYINCAEIQGNGWEINNAHNIQFDTYYSSYAIIRNLHFLNIYNSRGEAMFNIDDNNNIYDCKFSGVLSGRNSTVNYSGDFNRCAFNFKTIDNVYDIANGDDYNRAYYRFCKICIDHSSNGNVSFSPYARYYNSYIEHIIPENDNLSVSYRWYEGKSSILHSGAGNYILSSNGTKISVTEEQLKDAEYLASVGFPIIL